MEDLNPYRSSDIYSPGKDLKQPTQVRFQVLGLSVLMAVLLYLDRFALNAVQPVVVAELGLTSTQIGWVTSAFFWTYALAQIPAGTLGDRWGGRLMLTVYVATWSIAFGLQAAAFSFLTFLIFRALQGVAQAGAYSVTAGFLKQWIPPTNRSFANGSVSMGGRAGGVLTNIITPVLVVSLAPLMLRLGWFSGDTGGSWRIVFLVYASLGLVWAIVFWFWFRDTPREHGSVNAHELAVISPPELEQVTANSVETVNLVAPPFWIIFRNRNAWLLSAIMLLVNVGWIFLTTYQTTYLKEVFNSSLVKAGSYTALTGLGGMAGCLLGGFAADRMMQSLGIVWGRRIPGLVACGGAAAMYFVSLQMTSSAAVVFSFGCVYFLNDFLLGSLWSTVQDVGQRNSGALFGFVNMSGNLGAAIFPPVIGMLVDAKLWPAVFMVSGGAFMLAFVLWFFVDPRIKLPEHVAA